MPEAPAQKPDTQAAAKKPPAPEQKSGSARPAAQQITAAVPTKTAKKVPEKLPEEAEVAVKEAKAAKEKEEKKKASKLSIKRPGQREFDRHSGTGRGMEQPKDGAGKGNWGKDTDPTDQLNAEPIDPNKLKPKPDAAPAASTTETPAEDGKKKEMEIPENVKTMKDFLKAKKKKAKVVLPSTAAPATAVEEEALDMQSLQPVAKKVEEEPSHAPAPSVASANKKEQPAKKPAEPAAAKPAIKIEFYGKDRRLEGEAGPLRSRPPRPFQQPRPRYGEPVNIATLMKEPVAAPSASSSSVLDQKAFPAL